MKDIEKKKGGVIPATDILEMDDGFHIIMDMPGVSVEDIVIDIEESELSIRGSSTYMEASNNLRRLHTEFGAQQYERNFTLSDLVDHDNVKADLKDGVLRLYLPKAESMKPRRITIS
ncbi:Hsp20/alpha crystallin family protein [Desulfovibrio sp. OttesenSCG-928-C06]|nr:Hsp20/alpha crystallin family protein [Desulfovibrio sp. OttesenSCG-928-C06]